MPTFVQEAEVSFGTANTVATTPSFDGLTGDLLVAVAGDQDNVSQAISNSGAALTWTLAQDVNVTGNCRDTVWTHQLAGARTGLTVSATTIFNTHGLNVLTWRSTNGVGTSVKSNGSGVPSIDITTTQDSSGLVVAIFDWSAQDGTSRAWLDAGGVAAIEVTYFRDAAFYSAYIAYYPDVGSAALRTVGLTAPGGQTFAIVAVEVLDIPPTVPPEQTALLTVTHAQ